MANPSVYGCQCQCKPGPDGNQWCLNYPADSATCGGSVNCADPAQIPSGYTLVTPSLWELNNSGKIGGIANQNAPGATVPSTGGVLYQSNPGSTTGTNQILMASGDPMFKTIYSGAPLTTDFDPNGAQWGPNLNNTIETNPATVMSIQNDGIAFTNPIDGPTNTQANTNYMFGQGVWGMNAGGPHNPAMPPPQGGNNPHVPFPGLSALGTPNASDMNLLNTGFLPIVYQSSFSNSTDYTNAINNFTSQAYASVQNNVGQDWTMMIHQGMQGNQGQGNWFGSVAPNTGGQYAMMTAPWPNVTSSSWNPQAQDLVTGCTAPSPTFAPSYSFLGYCTRDIVVPDAWNPQDPTKTVTIKCPTTQTTVNGKPVTVPGLVCVQGSDSDVTQASKQTALWEQIPSGGVFNSWGPPGSGDSWHDAFPFWNTADIAPSCLDVAVNGNLPQPVNKNPSNSSIVTNTNLTLNGTQWSSSNLNCIPLPSGDNSIGKCFNQPSDTPVYVKNVCQAQMPIETWGNYAWLSNGMPSSPVPFFNSISTNYNNPQANQPVSSLDVFERFWKAQPLHNSNLNGTNWITQENAPASLEVVASNPNGPQSNVNTGFYGYQARAPKSYVSAQTIGQTGPVGLMQMNDMSDFYNAQGATTFAGNYGAVPGASDSSGLLAQQPPYKDWDFAWQ